MNPGSLRPQCDVMVRFHRSAFNATEQVIETIILSGLHSCVPVDAVSKHYSKWLHTVLCSCYLPHCRMLYCTRPLAAHVHILINPAEVVSFLWYPQGVRACFLVEWTQYSRSHLERSTAWYPSLCIYVILNAYEILYHKSTDTCFFYRVGQVFLLCHIQDQLKPKVETFTV